MFTVDFRPPQLDTQRRSTLLRRAEAYRLTRPSRRRRSHR